MTYHIFTYSEKEKMLRGVEGIWIPFDEANTDYQAYLAWIAEGNTAEEWQPETGEEN
jgi:hypothetical protein